MGHTDAVVVLTTLATTDEAAKFVRALLERRLVACGTILPAARSLYRWEDKLGGDKIEAVVRRLRPYPARFMVWRESIKSCTLQGP